jgi:branched-chain amino acid transport system substrate-binding protein
MTEHPTGTPPRQPVPGLRSHRGRLAVAVVAVLALVSGCANQLTHAELVRDATGDQVLAAGGSPASTQADTAPAATTISVVPSSPTAQKAANAAGTPDQLSKAAPALASGTKAAPAGNPVAPVVKRGKTAGSPAAAAAAPSTAGAHTAVCTAAKSPIVLGGLGQMTGVLGVAFVGGTHAIEAWIAMINASGGLGCHPVKYITADDGGDPARNLALARRLVEQDHVIAMLYDTALLTSQASTSYLQGKGIPIVGQEGGELEATDSPIYFNHASAGLPLIQFTEIAGARVAKAEGKTKVGTLTCQEVSYCNTADSAWAELAPKLGLQLAYRGKASLLNVDFTSQCLAAKSAGVQALVLAFESTGIHRIAQSCASVGYKPLIVCTSVQSNPDFRTDDNLADVVIAQPLHPWFLSDFPAIRQYQAVLHQYSPEVGFDAASINGWTAAQLFSRATSAFTSDTVTSEGIMKALWTVKDDDLGGLTYPLSFRADKPQEQQRCGWVVRVTGGQFTSDGQRFCG